MTGRNLQLLGPVQVLSPDGDVPRFRSQRTMALLGYLVAEQRAVSRDTLAALLWPDETQSKGRGSLRRELHNLNQILPDCWELDRQSVQFVPADHTGVDLFRFQEFEQTEQWTEAAKLVRGEFLEGLYLDDNLEFETWLLGERERWRQRAENVLTRVVERYTRQAAYGAALDSARTLLQLAPWNEAIHRQVMLLLARTGQYSAAIKQFETCRQILANELGVEPSVETALLFKRIWSAQTSPPYDVPTPPTAFIGRAAELTDIKQRLTDPVCRLLTLVGPGGIGKTRLAIQAATERRDNYLNGAVFIPLARVTSADFLIPAIAESLHLRFHGQESPQDQLIEHLQERELLLVMDNFEHLLTGADLLAEILSRTTDVKILATSRQRLNLSGEWVYQVQGLDFPHQMNDPTPSLEVSDAGQLFLQAARRVRADFQPSSDDALAIAQVCRIVDGMPLGLELAAAWMRALSCAEIVREIEGDPQVLATTQRDIPKRHRSLRAVFESSWNMLSQSEKDVLALWEFPW
jgi:DNA-binding SARP family transcriptional activator